MLTYNQYIGVDHPGMIEIIGNSGTYLGENIMFLPFDFETRGELDLEGKVDRVVSFETIEHVSDPLYFLSQIGNNLKQNGKLILSTPNNPWGLPPKYSDHIKEYSVQEIHQFLRKSRYSVDETYSLGIPFGLISLILSKSGVKVYRSEPESERSSLSKITDHLGLVRKLMCQITPYAFMGDLGTNMIVVASKN